MTDQGAVLRIGEVARRTGVGVPTLRAWEGRYGLLTPARTGGGHRLYSDHDVARVRSMQALLDQGWAASAAARAVLRETAAPSPDAAVAEPGEGALALVRRLRDAIERFDAAAADAVVDDALARLEVARALDEVLLPVVRHLGDGWEDDPGVIAREHVASNSLRPRLQRLLRAPARPGARACVAAAPEDEHHDLGLLAAAVVAADAGWHVHYLGARTPTAVLERTVAELAPAVVLVGAVLPEPARAFLAAPPRIAPAGLVLGGAGFTAGDRTPPPGTVVHAGPIRGVAAACERAAGAG